MTKCARNWAKCWRKNIWPPKNWPMKTTATNNWPARLPPLWTRDAKIWRKPALPSSWTLKRGCPCWSKAWPIAAAKSANWMRLWRRCWQKNAKCRLPWTTGNAHKPALAVQLRAAAQTATKWHNWNARRNKTAYNSTVFCSVRGASALLHPMRHRPRHCRNCPTWGAKHRLQRVWRL